MVKKSNKQTKARDFLGTVPSGAKPKLCSGHLILIKRYVTWRKRATGPPGYRVLRTAGRVFGGLTQLK